MAFPTEVNSPITGNRSFVRWTAGLAIVAGILALLSLVVGLMAVDYEFDVFEDYSLLIAAGSSAATLIRWSYWFNMVGNYLFLIPLALLLYGWLIGENHAFAILHTGSGLLYMVLGAAGSAILAAAWPQLMESYAVAAASDQGMLLAQFHLVTAIAEVGLHGVIQNLCGAVWFLGMGNLLRSQRKGLGIFGMVVGGFLVLNTLGNMFNVEALSQAGLFANILLGPVWSILIGVNLIRNPLK